MSLIQEDKWKAVLNHHSSVFEWLPGLQTATIFWVSDLKLHIGASLQLLDVHMHKFKCLKLGLGEEVFVQIRYLDIHWLDWKPIISICSE